eukprot:Nk52_evm30s2657 gene=Nk52_evmTU30s2657
MPSPPDSSEALVPRASEVREGLVQVEGSDVYVKEPLTKECLKKVGEEGEVGSISDDSEHTCVPNNGENEEGKERGKDSDNISNSPGCSTANTIPGTSVPSLGSPAMEVEAGSELDANVVINSDCSLDDTEAKLRSDHAKTEAPKKTVNDGGQSIVGNGENKARDELEVSADYLISEEDLCSEDLDLKGVGNSAVIKEDTVKIPGVSLEELIPTMGKNQATEVNEDLMMGMFDDVSLAMDGSMGVNVLDSLAGYPANLEAEAEEPVNEVVYEEKKVVLEEQEQKRLSSFVARQRKAEENLSQLRREIILQLRSHITNHIAMCNDNLSEIIAAEEEEKKKRDREKEKSAVKKMPKQAEVAKSSPMELDIRPADIGDEVMKDIDNAMKEIDDVGKTMVGVMDLKDTLDQSLDSTWDTGVISEVASKSCENIVNQELEGFSGRRHKDSILTVLGDDDGEGGFEQMLLSEHTGGDDECYGPPDRPLLAERTLAEQLENDINETSRMDTVEEFLVSVNSMEQFTEPSIECQGNDSAAEEGVKEDDESTDDSEPEPTSVSLRKAVKFVNICREFVDSDATAESDSDDEELDGIENKFAQSEYFQKLVDVETEWQKARGEVAWRWSWLDHSIDMLEEELEEQTHNFRKFEAKRRVYAYNADREGCARTNPIPIIRRSAQSIKRITGHSSKSCYYERTLKGRVSLLSRHYHSVLSFLEDVPPELVLHNVGELSNQQSTASGPKPGPSTVKKRRGSTSKAPSTCSSVSKSKASNNANEEEVKEKNIIRLKFDPLLKSKDVGNEVKDRAPKISSSLKKLKSASVKGVRDVSAADSDRKSRKKKLKSVSLCMSDISGQNVRSSAAKRSNSSRKLQKAASTPIPSVSGTPSTAELLKLKKRKSCNSPYDIDNIVIPTSMVTTRVEKIEVKDIRTPQWRVWDSDYWKQYANEVCSEAEIISDDSYLKRHSNLEAVEKKRFAVVEEDKEKAGNENSHKRKAHPVSSIKKGFIPPAPSDYYEPGFAARKFPLSQTEFKRVKLVTPVVEHIWENLQLEYRRSMDNSSENICLPGLSSVRSASEGSQRRKVSKSKAPKKSREFGKRRKIGKGPRTEKKRRDISICSNHSEAESLIDVGTVNDCVRMGLETSLDGIPDTEMLLDRIVDGTELTDLTDPSPSR